MTEDFEYFDGREWAGNTFYEWERDSVEIVYDEAEVTVHGRGRQTHETIASVDPPHRYLYPRPIESLDEARTLYLTDEINIYEFEQYLERLL